MSTTTAKKSSSSNSTTTKKVRSTTFTELIQREKTNTTDYPEEQDDNEVEEELIFEEISDCSPQPRPDLLAFLSEVVVVQEQEIQEETKIVNKKTTSQCQQEKKKVTTAEEERVTVVSSSKREEQKQKQVGGESGHREKEESVVVVSHVNGKEEQLLQQQQQQQQTKLQRKKTPPPPPPPTTSPVFSRVCVRELKSSFSKFDKLDKSRRTGEQETPTCKSCLKPVFLVELIKAEKASWHKNCFKCCECARQLSVDTYSSHEGALYCKPHHRSLFLPKNVITDDTPTTKPPPPALIIAESVPVVLPPDVVRATDKEAGGLEDLQIDVRSRFEVFEKRQEKEKDVVLEPVVVKRSPSVLSKLLKYEPSTQTNGVLTETLGDPPEGDSDDDSETAPKLKSPLAAMQEIMAQKQVEEVRSRWREKENESKLGGGGGSREEAMAEERRAEMIKFRSRLCQGKSSNLKSLYENYEEKMTTPPSTNPTDPSLETIETSSKLRQLFETGSAFHHPEAIEKPQLDMDVFEVGVGKEGRKLWEEMDKQTAETNNSVQKIVTRPQKFVVTRETQPIATAEVVNRAGEAVEENVAMATEDLRERFRFFEEQRGVDNNKERKEFKMELEVGNGGVVVGGAVEAYRDPTIVTMTTTTPHTPPDNNILTKSKTASKMLSVFRELELARDEQPNNKERKFKEFTPPREGVVLNNNNDQEGEESEGGGEGEESDEGEEFKGDPEKDAFLKEVGSLARARSLRARFEKWEQSENERNSAERPPPPPSSLSNNNDDESCDSIESAKILRARFEEKVEQDKEVKISNHGNRVRRFVEEEAEENRMADAANACAYCEKKVYAMEKLEACDKVYHKTCFRCSVCKNIMRLDAFTFHHGALYCKNHFKQLFKIKGNYDEGFGHETQKQIFAKKQAEKN